MRSGTKIVLVAVAAGTLGVVAGLLTRGPGPLLRTEPGQRIAQQVLQANAPAAPEGVAVAKRGEVLPAFAVAALDGGDIALPDDFAGRPLLVNVWASWCGPCIREMPELDRYARAQGDDGTRVLGIALDDPAAVRDFLQRVPVSYPLAIDAPGRADAGVRLGNPRGVLPYSVLVSADGRVLKQRIGPFEDGEVEGWARP
ncbi:TlpA disulfide reductase family protein [Luteimonas sp. R10]|uniref:TlpA disulfide reductase family protein n=1 Tax=Luteimonas sp. R10 TaxID=3108176 RepID=UPI00308BC2FE|nr:TlpA disulfide reductase family protein [Luteimonas sp. R10]